MTEEQIAELLMRLYEISVSLSKIAQPIRNICPLCENPVYVEDSARYIDHDTTGIVRKPDKYGYSSYTFDTPINLPAHLWVHAECLNKVRL